MALPYPRRCHRLRVSVGQSLRHATLIVKDTGRTGILSSANRGAAVVLGDTVTRRAAGIRSRRMGERAVRADARLRGEQRGVVVVTMNWTVWFASASPALTAAATMCRLSVSFFVQSTRAPTEP
jgi:hypothetical protein